MNLRFLNGYSGEIQKKSISLVLSGQYFMKLGLGRKMSMQTHLVLQKNTFFTYFKICICVSHIFPNHHFTSV